MGHGKKNVDTRSLQRVVVLLNKASLNLCPPTSKDGLAVNRLVATSPPLDTNSVYCNLLQCTHFADTSLCAKRDGELVGFVSGYLIPLRVDTLFIWQVAVTESARGQGVAIRMLEALLKRPLCRAVAYLETTITPANEGSWRLFKKLAASLGVSTETSVLFEKEGHFHGAHDAEYLLRLGPLSKPDTF